MMELSSSSYYDPPKVLREERERLEAELRDAIERIRCEQPRLGYRMLLRHLKRSGIKIGERRLRKIVRKFQLQIRPRKRFVKTTDSDHACEVHPNLILGMTLDGINQVWVSDITYVRIRNGFVYVAVILDVYSRKVIGWQISKTIDGQLTLDALKMAILRRNPPRGVIHHSDRGVQYLCEDYVNCLKDRGFHLSCAAKGNPYENPFAEAFMKTLKENEVYLWEYETFLDVYERVPDFFEEMYNRKRLHSSLDYLTPEEFEKKIELEDKNDRPLLEL
jgi:transposase InsO family protein